MAPTRSASTRLFRPLIYTLLCFVVMHMLGTPASLWQPDFQTDLVDASLLEGLSLVPSSTLLHPVVTTFQFFDLFVRAPSVLLGECLFRPPSAPHPPMPLA